MTTRERGPQRGRKRAKGAKEPQPLTLVLCQGEVTEPQYFQTLKRLCRLSHFKIEADPLDPKKLVAKAKTLARRSGYDRVYVVIDVDDTPVDLIHQAISSCRSGSTKTCSFSLVVSNQSFDCWLYAHVCTASIHETDRKWFQKKLTSAGHLVGPSKKTLCTDFPVEDWREAAQKLEVVGFNELGSSSSTAIPTLLNEILPT